MREILFRGKQTDKDKWIYGVPIKGTAVDESKIIIIESVFECDEYLCRGCEFTPVIPETVGQYTGLTDKNGTRIFEGDIVREAYGDYYQGFVKLIVEMDDDRGGWFPFAHGDGCGCCEDETWDRRRCEVIGNIHDNPELVEVRK